MHGVADVSCNHGPAVDMITKEKLLTWITVCTNSRFNQLPLPHARRYSARGSTSCKNGDKKLERTCVNEISAGQTGFTGHCRMQKLLFRPSGEPCRTSSDAATAL